MPRRFDLARLFAPDWRRDPKLVPYPTLESEFDAVHAGTKAMSQQAYRVSSMTVRDRDYRELLELAFRRDLVVVLHNRWRKGVPFARQDPAVFVTRPSELWRVPAWLTLWDATRSTTGWTDAAEEQSSVLLGYDEADRARWRAHLKRRRANGSAFNVHVLLTSAQKRRIAALGRRCLGTAEELTGMTLLFHRDDHGVTRNAHLLVPRGLTLARVGLRPPMFRKVFGDPRTWKRGKVIEATIPARLAPTVNEALASNVQFLTARGWR